MDIENISKRFNEVAGKYDSQRRIFIPCFDDYYGMCTSFLAYCRTDFKAILDLGAGTGLFSQFLFEKFPSAEFTLVDISEQMLDVARLRFKNCSNVEFVVADYSSGLPSGKFDLIASGLSIHHLDNDTKTELYRSIYGHLEDGGYLLNLDQFNAVSEQMNTCFSSFWYEKIKQGGIKDDECSTWLQRRALDKENSIEETLELLKSAGFPVVECIYKYLKFGVVIAVKQASGSSQFL
ncbi:MAG: class I SAM-dependent methyltransferase [Fibrobacter sp.]|nr:class I SAM-dependent methyltransferase [Fibrobacter sp.]